MIALIVAFAVTAALFGAVVAYLVHFKARTRPYSPEERQAWSEKVEEDLAA